MPRINIDGTDYDVAAARNLLQACLSLGFNLPYFCWHPAMGSVGACRQCAVKQFHGDNDLGDGQSLRPLVSVDPVGNYAVRLGFDDMHNTGIFSWALLHEIGRNAGQRFQSYMDNLAAKGLDRDRPGVR
jgi:DUF971 family protein